MKLNNLATLLFSSLIGFAGAEAHDFVPHTATIPAGQFLMGSMGFGENYDEAPAHIVNITNEFKMGVTEITNAQFEAFRPEHKALRGKNGFCSGDNEAVTNVSWNDAMAYCKWLSEVTGSTFRLPTEAEWEYACRAGTSFPFYTGDGLPASLCKNQQKERTPKPLSLEVGIAPANAFGLFDMHGNVEEWCLDWYGAYSDTEQNDPVGAEFGSFRVTRGGSHNTPTDYLRSANRMAMIPDDKHSMTGFRVVQAEYPKQWNNVKLHSNAKSKTTKYKWAKANAKVPYFAEPKPFVIEPECGSATPFFRHNHQPAITWCDNGDLLAIWFSANEENGREVAVLESRLHPNAKQWTPAQLFFKVPDRNMTGSSLLNDGKGHIFHMNGVEAAGDWQNLAMVLRKSSDSGLSWSEPKIVEGEHTVRHQVIQGPIITSNGTMIQLCDAGPSSEDGTSIHVSNDGGITWNDQWDGAPLPEFAEGKTGSTIAGIHAGIVELNDGRLMALGRGIDTAVLGSDGKKHMPISISSDGGKTWAYHASEFPPIQGHQRLVFMRLAEGPLMLVSFTDHPTRTPIEQQGMEFTDTNDNKYKGYGMYAALSYDDGKTWPVKKLITDGHKRYLNGGAWTQYFVMDQNHSEPRGYLAATQSPDGIIHLLSSRIHYAFNLAWLEK